jgi:hypothetical protein
VALAAPAALQDLGSLVLGHHALNLEQEIVLRREPDCPIEENNLDPCSAELVHQEHLVGIAPGQPVGRVDIEAIQAAGGDGIPQALERGPDEGGAAIAFVDEAVVRRQSQIILCNPRLKRCDLAGDGRLVGLLLG